MKQILVPKYFFSSGTPASFASDTTHENPIGFVHADALDTFLDEAPTKDFIIMYRSGKTQAPMAIEVDYDSLSVMKSQPSTVDRKDFIFDTVAGEANKDYTINIIKRNVNKHERNIYRISVCPAIAQTATQLAALLVAQFNRLKFVNDDLSDITMTNSDEEITINVNPVNYSISLADGLRTVQYSIDDNNTDGLTLTIKDLERLISEGSGNRGAQYRYEEGPTIYPFVEQLIEGIDYVVYTLRFATNRKAAKTRDEQVWQLVHMIVNPAITTLTDYINSLADARPAYGGSRDPEDDDTGIIDNPTPNDPRP